MSWKYRSERMPTMIFTLNAERNWGIYVQQVDSPHGTPLQVDLRDLHGSKTLTRKGIGLPRPLAWKATIDLSLSRPIDDRVEASTQWTRAERR